MMLVVKTLKTGSQFIPKENNLSLEHVSNPLSIICHNHKEIYFLDKGTKMKYEKRLSVWSLMDSCVHQFGSLNKRTAKEM